MRHRNLLHPLTRSVPDSVPTPQIRSGGILLLLCV